VVVVVVVVVVACVRAVGEVLVKVLLIGDR
jgi:hypothetical protein